MYPTNDRFCIMPWVHQMMSTYGTVRPCCTSTLTLGKVEDANEIWNGPAMVQMREDMAVGRRIEGCDRCYKLEKHGKTSLRQKENDRWLHREAVQDIFAQSVFDAWEVHSKPIYLDLRFGNLCNLVCKMCSGSSSSQIVKDNAALKQADPATYKELINQRTDLVFDWHENPDVWEELDRYIPDIQMIYLTGGEPTLIEQNLEFMERCITLGHASKIDVRLNTNATNVNRRLMDIVQQFKSCRFSCSIDGTGLVQEYIRYPSKWGKIKENLIKLWQSGDGTNITVAINIVVQLFNILDLPDILTEFIELYEEHGTLHRDFKINVEPLTHPRIHDFSLAPPVVRARALARLIAWKHHNPEYEQYIANGWSSINGITSMLMADAEKPNDPNTVLRLAHFTDSNKKIDMETSLPELFEILSDYC